MDHRLSWSQTVEIIHRNELQKLKRTKSDEAIYQAWKDKLKKDKQYGDIMDFILKEKLHWDSSATGSFSPPANWDTLSIEERAKLLYTTGTFCISENSFPYGFQEGIRHLVVWCSFHLPCKPREAVDPAASTEHSDLLLPESRVFIERYTAVNFVQYLQLEPDRVLWFKNWPSLQSVPVLEHFHVLLNLQGLDPARVEAVESALARLFGTKGRYE